MKLSLLIFLLCSIAAQADPTKRPSCIIWTEDFLVKSPLLFHYNSTKSGLVYSESSKKRIWLVKGDSIRLGCPNSTIVARNVDLPTDTIVITCAGDHNYFIESTYMENGGNEKDKKSSGYSIKEFECKQRLRPDFNEYQTQKCMNGSGVLRELSYSLSIGVVVPFIGYCLDVDHARTVWAYTKIHPWSPVLKLKFNKPHWSNEFLFPGIQQKNLYIEENQVQSFRNILGWNINSLDAKKGMILSRGHLIASMDLHYPVQRAATYDYANILPQWANINNGNWKEIEHIVRNFANKQNHNLDVWTGGLGIMQMKNRYHKLKDIYLNKHTEENPEPIPIPIPRYFFKMVYDKNVNQGIVFVIINNPFLKDEDIVNSISCRNVCEVIPIIQIRGRSLWENVKYGYTYCCEINGFIKQNPALLGLEFPGATLLKM